MDRLLRDLRLALRSLRRQPGFTAVVAVTLALGIGVNLSILQVAYGILMRPLPLVDLGSEAPDAERGLLLALAMRHETQSVEAFDFSLPDIRDFREQCTVCEGVAAFDARTLVLAETDDGSPAAEGNARRVRGQAVSPELFRLLGAAAALGRTLDPELDQPGGPAVVVLSHGLWQQLGADPGLLGGELRLDGALATVVGIMPEGFHFPERSQLWIPLEHRPEAERADRWVDNVLVRLEPGVRLEQAEAGALAISKRLARSFPASNQLWAFTTMPFRQRLVSLEEQEVLGLLMAAVGLVLLIACVNVTNLLLARESSRRRAAAVHVALGSSRTALIRHRMTENLVLAALGGTAGLLVSAWLLDAIADADPNGWPTWVRFELGAETVLMSLGLTGVSALFFGLVPALRASRPDLGAAISGGRGTVAGREQRMQQGLVVAQIALASTLLVGAGLVVERVRALAELDAGFETEPILALQVQLADERYTEPEARVAVFDRISEALSTLPGVQAAAATSALPLAEDGTAIPLDYPGRTLRDGERLLGTYILQTRDLFDVFELPLLAGRRFTPAELADPESRVVIVGEALARRIWGSESPLGQRIRLGYDEGAPWSTVIGVAPQVYYEEPGEESDQSRLQVHLPYGRIPWRSMELVLRASVEPATLGPQVRRRLAEIDPGMAVDSVFTMTEVRHRALWGERLQGQLFSTFALMALLLSAVGIYGVMAYVVVQRIPEIGVRMALGAERRHIGSLVVRRGTAMVGAGMLLGCLGAVLVYRLLGSALHGVGSASILPFLISFALLIAAAGVGVALPTRRALSVDPAATLRGE